MAAAHGQHQAVARRAAAQSCARLRLLRRARASARTAAARPSSGVGRDHIQYLASLFHPDTPNDMAPGGYNEPELPDGMPQSPLEPRIAATGFRCVARRRKESRCPPRDS